MGSLSSRLSPNDLEHAYRVWEWRGAMRRARIAIVTASAVFLLFVYPDFLFVGLKWPFAGLFALRLSVTALGIGVLWLLAGEPRPERYDRLLFVWTAWVGLLTAVILPASRPNAWILHGFIVCTAIPTIYTLIPTTFVGGLVIGVGMGVGYLGYVIATNAELAFVQGVVICFALFAANVIGAVTSRWLHQSQRATFLQENALRRAEDNLNTLVDAVPFPLALLGRADGRMRRMNDAARALFAAHQGGAESAIARLVAALPPIGDDVTTHELATDVGEGVPRWLLLSIRPIVHDGAACTLVGFVDISARKQAEEVLASAKRDADDASRAKSTFLATMSHEIRTPLHGVLGAVQLLERAPLAASEREHVATIRFSANGMLELVDGILDLARAETGIITPLLLPFDVRRLVQAVVDSVAGRVQAQGLTVDIDETLPAIVVGDEARIRRALLNLVDNALKYGDGARIGVSVRALAASRVRFAVDNGGPGIPPEARAAIFEPFVRLAAGDDARGFGLGLAICRRDVEAMGGTLALDDGTPGRTTFVFDLPLAPGTALPSARPDAVRAARPLTVLVAEDDPLSGRLALALLAAAGHRATLVGDGPDAVRAAGAGTFDAILMDIRLPGFDGVEATRRIRATTSDNARVPIIATTANALAEDRARYLSAGVTTVMPKPIDFDALEALLAELTGAISPATGWAPPASEGVVGGAPWIDEHLLARYARMLGEGPAHELIELGVTSGATLVRAIEEAAARADASTVGSLAHRLASAAHSSALTRLATSAADLEAIARGDVEALAPATERVLNDWQATLAAHAARGAGAARQRAWPGEGSDPTKNATRAAPGEAAPP